MARVSKKLTWTKVRNLKRPGKYGDGDGLWLDITPSGVKSWCFRYASPVTGKPREMGLGAIGGDLNRPTVSLDEARDLAHAARKLKQNGIDPLDARRAEQAAERAEAARAVTFADCAGGYIKVNRKAWRSAKHAAQWRATLEQYVFPVIGALPVGAVETGHVTRILEPLWTTKTETATRLRGRIETVLDFAAAHGWRQGDNPARWRGHLQNILPTSSKVTEIRHHAALPWAEIAAFMRELDPLPGVPALALRFGILCAARAGEVLGATWGEINMQAGTWVVPGSRMKAGREHRVPLSEDAQEVLRAAAGLRERAGDDALVFPGSKAGRPLSHMALHRVLVRLGRGDLTTHGFRSSFSTWCAEATNHPRELVEQSLAHTIGNAVEAAYRRTDLFEKRRRLMAEWAGFCARPAASGEVVPLRAGA